MYIKNNNMLAVSDAANALRPDNTMLLDNIYLKKKKQPRIYC